MKKRNLIILLLIPFVIALFGIVTINVTFNLIDNDIVGISWTYNDIEGFSVNNKYKLVASGISESKYPVSLGNKLIWSLKNKDSEDTIEHASIILENNDYYLNTISEGEILITCSNEKGTLAKTMTGVIYSNGAIIINPKIKSSQSNVDSEIYYGEYDYDANFNKKKAVIEYEVTTMPESFKNNIYIKESSSNINFNLVNNTLSVISAGKAYLTLACDGLKDASINLNIVKDGLNIYDYESLLQATNKSENGEIVVLRKSFESMDNYLLFNENNIEMFGKFTSVDTHYDFKDDIYRFKTTFNAEYIAQWNEFASNNKNYSSITDEVLAGLHIQKDFYGNGYTINFHNLAFPFDSLNVSDDNGNMYVVPELNSANLFRGPLPFYTLGDPNKTPLIGAFGQDNVGMYIDGDNITVNDVNVKNADFGNMLSNLTYTGSVMDLNGSNITIKNSRLSNGKNVLRCFSCPNATITNCLLANSRNFLITTGANEYAKINGDKVVNFTLEDGTTVSSSISDFLKAEASGDSIVTNYISSNYEDNDKMKKAILDIGNALNDKEEVENIYKGSLEINDCLFYQSGISSIALESYFNGPYLFAKAPSLIGNMFSSMSFDNSPLVPLEPENISGISYPVKVNLSGDCRFYDFKKVESLDISGLIMENISVIANSVFEELDGSLRKITIDDIFPIKELLTSAANNANCIISPDDEIDKYFNIVISYYGGGLNLSSVTYDGFDNIESLGNILNIDLISNYINRKPTSDNLVATMQSLMIKTVTTVIGCEPFKFVCIANNDPLLKDTFKQTPNVATLIEQARR